MKAIKTIVVLFVIVTLLTNCSKETEEIETYNVENDSLRFEGENHLQNIARFR